MKEMFGVACVIFIIKITMINYKNSLSKKNISLNSIIFISLLLLLYFTLYSLSKFLFYLCIISLFLYCIKLSQQILNKYV